MQLQVINDECSNINQLIVIQDQGDNTPINIQFPYDVTGYTFTGTINFPVPILLSLGSGIEVSDIVSCTGSIAGNILTISAITSGTIYPNMAINGLGILSNTVITAFGTGTGGTGTYLINQSQTASSTVITSSEVTLQLTSDQTQDVPVGQYAFDLWTTSPDMNPVNTDPIVGFFRISESLTRIS